MMATKILIVDDEPDILELVRLMLESDRYVVATTQSAEAAAQLISKERPDLLLLDVVLPGMSGLELCRQLKRDASTRLIKIIIFSALGTGVDIMLKSREKADGYLLKPFSKTLLLNKVHEILHDEDFE